MVQLTNMNTAVQRKPRYRRTGIDAYEITERDVDIIKHIARHRFMRSTHIDQLFPEASWDNLRRRLDILFQSDHLQRPRSQRERFKVGGGSPAIVYALGNRGADLLATEAGFRRSSVDWTAKARDVSRFEIDHALEVTDFMVRLERACREHGALRVIYLDEIVSTIAPPETRENPRPYFWRVSVQWRGKDIAIHPIPDRIFGIQDLNRPEGKNRKFYYLECDRGTMPVVRSDDLSKTSYLRKLLAYGYTYRANLHTKIHGFPNIRVLTVTKGRKRIEGIIAAHQQYTWSLCSPKVFLFADRTTLLSTDSFFDYPWTDGAGEQHRLLE